MTCIACRGKEEVPYCFLGYPSNFSVSPAKKLDLDPIWERLLGWLQLSNLSDLFVSLCVIICQYLSVNKF